jgi:hypothetical protein
MPTGLVPPTGADRILAMLEVALFQGVVIHPGPFTVAGSTRVVFHAWK